ncbi:MAG: hypothetical protein LBT47_00660 [Deltaproteobacteria bacterium]|nr:hypothetical protein [Deltaproteobacteria bacterium]
MKSIKGQPGLLIGKCSDLGPQLEIKLNIEPKKTNGEKKPANGAESSLRINVGGGGETERSQGMLPSINNLFKLGQTEGRLNGFDLKPVIVGDYSLRYCNKEQTKAQLLLRLPSGQNFIFGSMGPHVRNVTEHLLVNYSLSVQECVKSFNMLPEEVRRAKKLLFETFRAATVTELLFKLTSKAPKLPKDPRLSAVEFGILEQLSQGIRPNQIAAKDGLPRECIRGRIQVLICKLSAVNINHALIMVLERAGLLKTNAEIFDDFHIVQSLIAHGQSNYDDEQ